VPERVVEDAVDEIVATVALDRVLASVACEIADSLVRLGREALVFTMKDTTAAITSRMVSEICADDRLTSDGWATRFLITGTS
jgi:hypothetical protein